MSRLLLIFPQGFSIVIFKIFIKAVTFSVLSVFCRIESYMLACQIDSELIIIHESSGLADV